MNKWTQGDKTMRSPILTNLLLLIISLLLAVLCYQNMQHRDSQVSQSSDEIQKVEIYQNDRPVGSALRPSRRGNPIPVKIVD